MPLPAIEPQADIKMVQKTPPMRQQTTSQPVKPQPYDSSFCVKPGFAAAGPGPYRPGSANYGSGKK